MHHFKFKDPKNCPLYNLIKNSIKTVEGRKYSPIYQTIKSNDIILLDNRKGILYCLVTYVHKYDTIHDYLEKETIQKTMPCASTIQEGIDIYNTFVKNEEIENIKKQYNHGFLAIGIKFLYEQKKNYVFTFMPFTKFIQKNEKIIEARPDKGKFSLIKQDVLLVFFSKQSTKNIIRRAEKVKKYKTTKEMILDIGLKYIFPNHNVKNTEEAVDIYYKYYKKEDVEKYGILAVHLSPKLYLSKNAVMKGGYEKEYNKYQKKYKQYNKQYGGSLTITSPFTPLKI